jgi:SAM-dependent methyltransferase
MPDLRTLVATLAQRDASRTEADIVAQVRQLLRDAPLGLHDEQIRLEVQVGDRRRIDVEAGFTVIEAKRDLRVGNIRQDAERQLSGYVEARTRALGQRYVGVLTDGSEWRAYQLRDGLLAEVAMLTVSPTQPDVERLVVWLEGVLATTHGIRPTPIEIARRLGVESTSHALDRSSLEQLYAANRGNPSIDLKRRLWARLLTTALGTQFEDTDDLFLNHTLLVLSAKVIAHAVLQVGFETVTPAVLLGGGLFERARISGVVESDFFDWVLEVQGVEGDGFIRTITRRLGRFDWSDVEHDVLKVLYESVIDVETRKRLGEYYTPDWLASQVVDTAVTNPLNERVLDAACGSGTFLFHAVRRYLAAADHAEMPVAATLTGLAEHVSGVDLHPVAVALARVTYLLAIGRNRLQHPDRGPIRVPVYLGDSLQWRQRIDLLSHGHLVIPVDDGRDLFGHELRFPYGLLDDVGAFDGLVVELANAASHHRPGTPLPGLAATFRRWAVPESDQPIVAETFALMCRLHDEGRDHIWGYYVRNLARPLWLSRPSNRVDVLVGNPPWLAFRHMSSEMQAVFRGMCESRHLWAGANLATHQDLSGLFVARAVQLYLRSGGHFGFVMPNTVVDRSHFEGFRSGEFPDESEPVSVAFDASWDLRRVQPYFFPRPAAVVFGCRVQAGAAVAMPPIAEHWSGRLPATNAAWQEVEPHIQRRTGEVHIVADDYLSPYRSRFSQGATLVPRVLLMVDEQQTGPLGLAAGEVAVRSTRSVSEKKPWKNLQPLEGTVETQFVRSALLGECVVPFRLLPLRKCVVPWDRTRLISGDDARIDRFPRLATWWREAERVWTEHRSSDRLSLIEQVDFRNKLSNQLPAADQRVVYSSSGMHIAAARFDDPTAIIDNSLYWAAAAFEDEAHYLNAILNSAITTARVRPLLSYSKLERHIHKHVWKLPIPLYDSGIALHQDIAATGRTMEAEVSALSLDARRHFSSIRREVRTYLAASEIGRRMEDLVGRLLNCG